MKLIPIQQIKDSLPEDKNRADSVWTRWVLRPLSVPVAWFCLRLSIRANTVSYLSALICIVGGLLFVSSNMWWALLGAVLFNLFALLDCADGNMARVTNTTGPYGGWADALGGYVAYVVVLLSIGFAAGVHESAFFGLNVSPQLWTLIGGIGAAANMLMRLAYQSYKNIAPEGQSGAKESISFEKMISENLGITGILMPTTLLALPLGALGYLIALYSAFYTAGCLVTLIKLIWKVEHASRA